MGGLSDIPCVGKAVDKISEVTVEAGIRGLRYLLCYNSILNNLNSEIEKVKVQEDRVSAKAVAESADGKTIKDYVTKWQKEVQEIKTYADELSKQRTSRNPITRFRLGRKATHETRNVAELTLSGVELLKNEIADLPADENIPISDTTYQKFDSREEAYGKLWEALVKEDKNQIIGIYGMPGVGKTTMMEQAWKDAKDKKVFNKVTRANVGDGNIDAIKLQNQLAGFIGCHFQSEDNEVHRASQLKNSLINGGKILVILDDVWDQIPLKRIGIPLGDNISNGCKILLTSRREDVCLRNGCKDLINITTLTVDEALDMFKNTVGTSKIDSLKDTSLAEKVCKECAGLPLLIHAVGNALKFVSEDSWRDALFQLENCNFEEIDGIDSRVYTCIRLSFDKLKKDSKTCLLLCSLFPEDTEIEIKMLEDFAIGSQLLNPGRNVRGMVDNLKSSSLLLKGESGRAVKIHDIIRDVARSVAASDQQYAFLFLRGASLLPDDYSTRKLLQFVESDNFGFPADMVCPDLHTMWLECYNKSQQFSNSFFEGIGNLKILVLKGRHVFPEQILSVQTFHRLTMLILDGCDLNEISLSIVPVNLETLRISECRLPNPLDLSKLKSLRKLEVLSEGEIEMAPNAVSTLSPSLAELHIPGGFRIFDAECKRSVSISSELNKLTALTSLIIRLEDSESCPAENIVANLVEFVVDVGDKHYSHTISPTSEITSVMFNNRCIGGGEVLVERAEKVILCNVKGSPNGFSNNKRQAFSNLTKLSIEYCHDMEHLASIPQYEIQQSQPPSYFSKLTSLIIDSCGGLKYLFSSCVAKCLVELKRLDIIDCPRLEVVIRKESAIDGVIIKFPKLMMLMLKNLESLRRFHGENRDTSSSSTKIMDNAATSPAESDSLFDEMVGFPALEILTIDSLNTREIWVKKNDSFCQLKWLEIRDCPNLKFAIPIAMFGTFRNLESLEICNCVSMTSEVQSSSNRNQNLVALVALLSIELLSMPALTQTGLNSKKDLYPNLKFLSICKCNSLRCMFLPSTVKDLAKHLKELVVQECWMMSEIIGEEEGEEDRNHDFVFLHLTNLQLKSLRNFKSFCFNKSTEAQATPLQHRTYFGPKVSFPKLEKLELVVKTITWEEIEVGRNNSSYEIRNLVLQCDKVVQLPYKWQLDLPNIEELSLKNCWWWHGSSGEHSVGQSLINPYGTPSFQRLKVVKVRNCGLTAIFSCSVFKNLHQLQKLEVRDCPLLEEVVRDEENKNIVGTYEKTITLLQLKSMELYNLPKLKSFSGTANYAFNMPALTSITLHECYRMEKFTCLEISTPLMPDFNTQIQLERIKARVFSWKPMLV